LVITTLSEATLLPEDSMIFSFDDNKYEINELNIHNYLNMVRLVLSTEFNNCNKLIVGIDPGFKRTGLAFFINKILVEALSISTDPAVFANCVNSILSSIKIPEKYNSLKPKLVFKVGNGNQIEMRRIISFICDLNIDIPFHVEVVDEFQTNSRFVIKESNFIKINKDARAAINIALRKGSEIKIKDGKKFNCNFSFTRKQVKQIQNESRKLSGHLLSIDKSLATKVLLGKMSLNEAIFIQKKRNT
ncbi:MAG: hypothetical protein ACTSRA_12140, partial [Promethearchaeota archaeon]